jgi:DNA-directed RNA polymerase subunit RPC12/RpoP
MNEVVYFKIACGHCVGHIEFPHLMEGQVINCPHCSLGLVLKLPATRPIPASRPGPAAQNTYQRLRALNDLPPPTPMEIKFK